MPEAKTQAPKIDIDITHNMFKILDGKRVRKGSPLAPGHMQKSLSVPVKLNSLKSPTSSGSEKVISPLKDANNAPHAIGSSGKAARAHQNGTTHSNRTSHRLPSTPSSPFPTTSAYPITPNSPLIIDRNYPHPHSSKSPPPSPTIPPEICFSPKLSIPSPKSPATNTT